MEDDLAAARVREHHLIRIEAAQGQLALRRKPANEEQRGAVKVRRVGDRNVRSCLTFLPVGSGAPTCRDLWSRGVTNLWRAPPLLALLPTRRAFLHLLPREPCDPFQE